MQRFHLNKPPCQQAPGAFVCLSNDVQAEVKCLASVPVPESLSTALPQQHPAAASALASLHAPGLCRFTPGPPSRTCSSKMHRPEPSASSPRPLVTWLDPLPGLWSPASMLAAVLQRSRAASSSCFCPPRVVCGEPPFHALQVPLQEPVQLSAANQDAYPDLC